MKTRDNEKIIQTIADLQMTLKQSIVEVIEAGAAGHTICALTEALRTLENAVCDLGESGGSIATNVGSYGYSNGGLRAIEAAALPASLLEQKVDALLAALNAKGIDAELRLEGDRNG